MARLHAAAFDVPRPWSAQEFADLLTNPLCFVLEAKGGFVMGRLIAGEAELLTIAVEPGRQGRGLGSHLMAQFMAELERRQAVQVFLEVAETNGRARALYRRAGFAETGRRRGYYHGIATEPVDAIVMSRKLAG
jgi:[ribosomal protein S18]-alanine N-acetyltransferase